MIAGRLNRTKREKFVGRVTAEASSEDRLKQNPINPDEDVPLAEETRHPKFKNRMAET